MTDLFRDLADAPEPGALTRGLWTRRVFVALFVLIAVLALADAFGQVTSTTTAQGPAARMALEAPARVRGGLMFQSRIEVRALRDIEHPRFVLARGWVEGMQVNSIEPQPMSEAPRDGDVVLSYDALKAGDRMTVWLQFQSDPTSIGRRRYDLALDDAEQPLVRIRRTFTVLP
jgi:hypothetical protein